MKLRSALAAATTTSALIAGLACAPHVHAVARETPTMPSAPTAPSAAAAPNPAPPSHARSHPAPASKPATKSASASSLLAGKTVGIDPGHNGRNYTDTKYIDRPIWNGREHEPCNETGTSTNAGYTEAKFTWRVATYLRKDLRAEGAHVVMTRHNNHGVGPCVNTRAHIINRAHADVGIDIHGDGESASDRGFAVLEPVRDKENRHVIGKSAKFGSVLRHQVLAGTSMPTSNYVGRRGITHRNDLAGLNLTKVPLVLIEAGNMRNSTDAGLMSSKLFQRRLAKAFAAAITKFARRHHH